MTIIGDEPVFESSLLLAGKVNKPHVLKQVSQWCRSGRLIQLRRGLYMPSPPFRKTKPHPFVLSNRILSGSYVSLQSALSHYGVIPEYVAAITAVTVRRPGVWNTQLGVFSFRHIRTSFFSGYDMADLGEGKQAFIAFPEKALLDLIYLEPGADSMDYVRELRLQNTQRFNPQKLIQMAGRSGSPKLKRSADIILKYMKEETSGADFP
ncbi:hypothetical protein JW906_11760 [bacterium]|nr:hypothetical protein [bacterium]